MPRVKLFNEEEALGKALELFWEKGYESTSLSNLTTHLSIGKGSFYDTFGSKKQLFDNCLEAYRISSMEVVDSFLAEKQNPVEGVEYFLNKHTEFMLADTKSRGCFIANSTVELSASTQIQEFLKGHNKIMKSKLMDYLSTGSFTNDIEVLADTILNHLTGISVMSKFIKNKEVFDKSNALFMQLIK